MGSVVLGLSPQLARDAAAAMLQLPAESVTIADQQDVAAELANMIGGNLKSLLPGPSFLSLPTIVAGHDIDLHVHHAELLEDVVLMSSTGPIHVRLYAQMS